MNLFPDRIGLTTGTGRDHLDRYYTPPALAEALVDLLPIQQTDRVLEPSAGGGAFVRAALQATPDVVALDIDPRSPGRHTPGASGILCDFLRYNPPEAQRPDWIIGNPPYQDAEDHVRHALRVTRGRVAFLLRLAFLESARRYHLWQEQQLRELFVLAERPSFSGDGSTDSAAYALFVWDVRRISPSAALRVVSWK